MRRKHVPRSGHWDASQYPSFDFRADTLKIFSLDNAGIFDSNRISCHKRFKGNLWTDVRPQNALMNLEGEGSL